MATKTSVEPRLTPRFDVPILLPVSVVVLVVALAFGGALLVLAAAAGIPILWAIVKRPQRGVLLLAALVPLNGLLLIFPVPGSSGWKETLTGALLVLTFFVPSERRPPAGRRLPGWLPAAGVYVLVGVISAVTVWGSQALVGLKIDYFYMLLAIVIWRAPLNRRERDQLVTIFMVVGFATAVFGIFQQIVGHATLHGWGYEYNTVIRFTSGMRLRSFSTFNQPFPFAFYLMIVILIGLPFALSDLNRIRSRLFLAAMPVYLLALLFSFVRGAWLGLGIGLCYLAFHRYKWLLLGVPLALVALLFLPGGSLSSAAFQSGSFTARTNLWSDRINQIVSHPFGGGIASTGAAASKVADAAHQANALLVQPDNSYLKTGFELGLPGLWMQILLLVALVLWCRKVERRVRGDDARFVMSFTAQLLGIIVAATVSTYFEIFPMDVLFWLMIGIVATIDAGTEPEELEAAAEPGPAVPLLRPRLT
jgi:putative inorganic carbon (HCO3(-)) transporter